ncbi:polysaccharide deacetylase family protein [Burkholderia alba]|uniref:polysaccharide deacetylase family protein n=1 Tax=Burkholderia alba TaxID=2683677 RepID=UPI002B056BA9|nr:polysaccharide deacetylase family protein [Burkholderia alba]
MSPQYRSSQRSPACIRGHLPAPRVADDTRHAPSPDIAILVYHRFSATAAADPMAVSLATLEAQLQHLRDSGYQFVPLRDIVAWRHDAAAPLPPKAVALTVDEGHRSIYDLLRPIASREQLPVTLFVYPSAVSHAVDTLTWDQLDRLHEAGRFDVQSHTWWHPDFNVANRQHAADTFRSAALDLFAAARLRIERQLGNTVDLLAWPFGSHDDALVSLAGEAGYTAGFTLDARKVRRDAHALTLPRYLMVEACTPAVLGRLLNAPGHACGGCADRRQRAAGSE